MSRASLSPTIGADDHARLVERPFDPAADLPAMVDLITEVNAFDDIPWFVHTDPPITAIAQPTGELGRAAVRALVDQIEGRPPQSVTLPARLVVRRSCGEPDPGQSPVHRRR